MRIVRKIVISLVAIISLGDGQVQSQVSVDFAGNTPFDKRMTALINSIDQRGALVWEGFYDCQVGVDEGYELLLSKRDGFMFRQVRNTGYSNPLSGPLEYNDESIVLNGINEGELPPALSKTMVIVHSNERMFVVPEVRIHGFCLDFTLSREYSMDNYFSKPKPQSLSEKRQADTSGALQSLLAITRASWRNYRIGDRRRSFHRP